MERITRINGLLAYRGMIVQPGPWHQEPDHVDFESDGFACILHRNGSWCGYVAVPPGHPWHGKGYDEVRVANDEWPDVHGGLTYSEKCHGAVCHVAKPGESDDVWWLGFDCNHSGDVSLSDITAPGLRYGTYRDVEYVRAETMKLAAQARAAAP